MWHLTATVPPFMVTVTYNGIATFSSATRAIKSLSCACLNGYWYEILFYSKHKNTKIEI